MTEISLTQTRIIRANRHTVFKAWTDPDQLVKWWGPGTTTCPEAEVDLRVGGVIRIANKIEDGSIIWINGAFEEVQEPEKLVYSWIMGEMMQKPTKVTVDFEEHPDGTKLVLSHTRFADEAVRDHHGLGWTGCIDKLAELVET